MSENGEIYKIKEINIAGIRSFKQEQIRLFDGNSTGFNNGVVPAQPLQNFVFNPNVTLICGSSGTGKTTIMEALKFAFCGNFPPSPDKSASFISLLDRGPTVTGKIELKLLDEAGRDWKSQLSFTWNKKRNKNDTENGPGKANCTLTSADGEIRRTTIIKKGDFEEQAKLFNLSPAVWEHIIIVSQAESEALWFFETPGELKKMFDKLLGLNDKNAKMANLRREAEILKKDLQNEEHSLEAAELRCVEFKKKSKERFDARVDRNIKTAELEPLETNLASIDTELKRLEKCLQAIRQYMSNADSIRNLNLFDTDLSDLNIPLLDQKIAEKESQISLIQHEIPALEDEEKLLTTDFTKLHEKIGIAKTNKANYNSNLVEKGRLLEEVIKYFELDSGAVNVNQIDTKVSSFEAKLGELQKIKESQIRQQERDKIQFEYDSQLETENTQQFPWDVVRNFFEQHESEVQCFIAQKAAIEADLNGSSISEQLGKTEKEIERNLQIQVQLSTYREITSLLNGRSDDDLAILQGKIRELESQADISKDLHELRNRKSFLLGALKQELAVEWLLTLRDNLKLQNACESKIYDAMEVDGTQVVSSGTRKRRHSSQEITQTMNLSSDGHFSKESLSEIDTVQLDSNISKLQNDVSDLREIRTKLIQVEKFLTEAENTCDSTTVQDYEKQIQNIQRSLTAKSEELTQKRNEEKESSDELAILKNQWNGLKHHEEMLQAEADLAALGFGTANLPQDEIDLKESEFSATLQYDAIRSELEQEKESIVKLEGSIDQLTKELKNSLAGAFEYYDGLLLERQEKKVLRSVAISDAEQMRTEIIEIHQSELQSLNGTLKEYWQNFYPYLNSISYIELAGIKEKNCSPERVSYDYHFEMRREKIQMKMRGCASQGEKYWASIIIRCALAQKFARNCPVLAFDSPEVNLDPDSVPNLIKLFDKLSSSGTQLIITSTNRKFLQRLDEGLTVPNRTTLYNLQQR